MIALALFTKPMVLHFHSLLWLLMPLCAVVALVYKTLRTEDLVRLPLEVARLVAYMVGGLVVLGGGLWLLHTYWPFS